MRTILFLPFFWVGLSSFGVLGFNSGRKVRCHFGVTFPPTAAASFFLIRNRSLRIGSHPPDLRHVSGRISSDFRPAAASVHRSHIFPCQNPFSGRFAVFRAFCCLFPAMPVWASLLRLPRYFGQQISSARKLCLQSRAQHRQAWLNFLRPVAGSIKKLQYCLSLLDILGMVSPPFFFWLQHLGTDFPVFCFG